MPAFAAVRAILGSSLLVAFVFSATAHAHPMVESWRNRMGREAGFSLYPQATLFSTDQNYDLLSQSIPIPNAVSLQRYYLDVNASYGFNDSFFVFARISALYTRITGSVFADQSNIGLSDQMIGAAYRLLETDSGWNLNLQGEITIPAYNNTVTATNSKPFLGDHTYDFTFGGFAEIPLSLQANSQLYLEGGAGYTYRSYGFSSAIPWNVLIKRVPSDAGITFSLGLRGNLSLETDTTFPAAAAMEQRRSAGGSAVIYAINPSWTLAQASIGYQSTDMMDYVLSGAFPLAGKNSPNGFQVSFGVQFNFNEKPSARKKISNAVPTSAFKQYDLEGKVLSSNDQLYLIKIDRGTDHGVEKGQIFDIFQDNQPVAKAKVVNVNNEESALRVLEYYQEQSIEVDAVVKRVMP